MPFHVSLFIGLATHGEFHLIYLITLQPPFPIKKCMLKCAHTEKYKNFMEDKGHISGAAHGIVTGEKNVMSSSV